MTEPPVREANCRCCGAFCGHGTDPEYCGACIEGGEPPDDWVSPAERVAEERENESTWSRPNLMKLRGYEFEEIVPWRQLIDSMKFRDDS